MKNNKSKIGRKPSDRNVPLYTRVSSINKTFVKEASIHASSEAHLVDTLLTHARRTMSRTQIKELFNVAKAGNKISAKISKAPSKAA